MAMQVFPGIEVMYKGELEQYQGGRPVPAWGNCQMGYLRLKILELFMVFDGLSFEENYVSFFTQSKAQADLAKEAVAYLTDHINEQITVRDLSARFYVSKTHMQNVFKGVYGVPVQSYIRMLKMQSAAFLLVHTDFSVLEVASRCGYDNSSKFAHAFRKIMGETPGEYRKMHGG